MSDPFPALDYEKIKQALSTAPARQKGFILQALRWVGSAVVIFVLRQIGGGWFLALATQSK